MKTNASVEHLSKIEASKINKKPLADKHGVSERYVGMVLTGQREAKTDTAKAILEDAKSILKVLA